MLRFRYLWGFLGAMEFLKEAALEHRAAATAARAEALAWEAIAQLPAVAQAVGGPPLRQVAVLLPAAGKAAAAAAIGQPPRRPAAQPAAAGVAAPPGNQTGRVPARPLAAAAGVQAVAPGFDTRGSAATAAPARAAAAPGWAAAAAPAKAAASPSKAAAPGSYTGAFAEGDGQVRSAAAGQASELVSSDSDSYAERIGQPQQDFAAEQAAIAEEIRQAIPPPMELGQDGTPMLDTTLPFAQLQAQIQIFLSWQRSQQRGEKRESSDDV